MLGLSVAFVVVGVGVTAALGPAVGLDADRMAQIGAVAMICFGLILLVPSFNVRFAAATAGISGQAEATARQRRPGIRACRDSFLGGMLLGAAWSPCIGPTLGGAISLGLAGRVAWSGRQRSWRFFAAGASTIILMLAYGTREAIDPAPGKVSSKIAANSKWVMADRAHRRRPRDSDRFRCSYRIEGWVIERVADLAAGPFGVTLSFRQPREKENGLRKISCQACLRWRGLWMVAGGGPWPARDTVNYKPGALESGRSEGPDGPAAFTSRRGDQPARARVACLRSSVRAHRSTMKPSRSCASIGTPTGVTRLRRAGAFRGARHSS